MPDDETRLYGFVLLLELSFLGYLLVVVVASLLGRSPLLAGYSVGWRLAALALLAVEFVLPLAVAIDIWRRPDDPDPAWLHAVVLPVVNVVGAIAYLEERRRTLGD